MKNKQLKETFDAKMVECAGKTYAELRTTDTNFTNGLLQASALVNLGVGADLREVCMVYPVAPNSGKKIEVPLLTSAAANAGWLTTNEGAAATPADPTMTVATITLQPVGQTTTVSDLVMNTAASSIINQVGVALGGSVRKGINNLVLDAMVTGAGNAVSCSSASGGAALTFVEVAAALAANGEDGYNSDFITCSNSSMWTAFTTSYAVTQFTGALNDLMVTGALPKTMGLDWYPDPAFYVAANNPTGKLVAVVGTKGMSAVCGQLQPEPKIEVWRDGRALADAVTMHIDFGAAAGFANSICKITYNS